MRQATDTAPAPNAAHIAPGEAAEAPEEQQPLKARCITARQADWRFEHGLVEVYVRRRPLPEEP